MTKKVPLKISSSITDFAPLFLDLEYMFKGLKATGIDGVELVIGIKSRWSVSKVKYLSQKYSLPITSIHQPVWSGLGVYFDEGVFAFAKRLGVTKVVCHPIPRYTFQSPQMIAYLKRLSAMQDRYNVEILLENLPTQYSMLIVGNVFRLGNGIGNIQEVFTTAKKYNLKATLDIDHLRISRPHREAWFKDVLPSIGNIHVSSFSTKEHHMPLYKGDFKAKEFVNYLQRENYKGLLTFEIYYPSLINPFSYDFNAIRKSVDLLR